MNKRSTRFYRKNEAEVMKRLGLRPTKNSGAGWIEKEDGQSEHCICQLKSTDKESISIKQHDLHVLEIHASESHKLPVFAFQFLNRDEVWLAVKESDIEEFKHVIRDECETIKYPPCFGNYVKGKCDRCMFWDKCKEEKEYIDEPEETEYNKSKGKEGTREQRNQIRSSVLAREKYKQERQQEREQQERRYKEKQREQKERNRNKWKRN